MAKILTSLHGRQIGLTDSGRLVTVAGYLAGNDGNQFGYAAPDRCVVTDDFLGAAISTFWGVHKGSDGGAANFAINAAQNGTARGVTGAGAGATMAVNGVQLDSALTFIASGGGVDFQARLKLSAITTVAVFMGFTNEAGTLQMPINGSGTANGLTNNAADAVGVLFDTTMSTADWWLVGVAGSTGATAQDAGSGPTAGTYDTWRINLSSAGAATFYRNSTQIGVQMPAAVTPTVALTPVIAAFRRSAASANIDVDYVYASGVRV